MPGNGTTNSSANAMSSSWADTAAKLGSFMNTPSTVNGQTTTGGRRRKKKQRKTKKGSKKGVRKTRRHRKKKVTAFNIF